MPDPLDPFRLVSGNGQWDNPNPATLPCVTIIPPFLLTPTYLLDCDVSGSGRRKPRNCHWSRARKKRAQPDEFWSLYYRRKAPREFSFLTPAGVLNQTGIPSTLKKLLISDLRKLIELIQEIPAHKPNPLPTNWASLQVAL